MATDPITFHCPACGIKLTVPGALAGVIGPCPSCRNQIQAPYPVPLAAMQAPAGPMYAAEPPPVQQAAPLIESYAAPIPAAPTAHAAVLAAPPVTQYLEPPAQQAAANTPAVLRPEPRQLPTRNGTADPVARPMPEQTRNPESAKAARVHARHPHSRNLLIRILVPVAVICAMVGVVFGVLTILNHKDGNSSPPKPTGKPVEQILPNSTTHRVPFETVGENPIQGLPVPDPEQPVLVQAPPDLPADLQPEDPGKEAEEMVYAFLAAKNLTDRLPMMETKTSGPELGKSCLAGTLPASSNVVMEFRETNKLEQVIDFYYGVDFDAGENRLDPHTLLVRKRGSSPPKIVADPFLDSFGGRLAAYASSPTDKAGIFEVFVSPLASCNDPKVPNSEKKYTLKLLPRDQRKEIARAYFGKQSKIGQMLEDRTYSLSFGKGLACTVMLHWNTEDRPETPYLEALDITSLDWNP